MPAALAITCMFAVGMPTLTVDAAASDGSGDAPVSSLRDPFREFESRSEPLDGAPLAAAGPDVNAETLTIARIPTASSLDRDHYMAYAAAHQRGYSIDPDLNVVAFDHAGRTVGRVDPSLPHARGIKFYNDRLFVWDTSGIVEIDPDALQVLDRWTLPPEPGAFPPLPEFRLTVNENGIEWISIDPDTGVETRAPRDFAFAGQRELVPVGTSGELFVQGTNNAPARLVDGTVWPPVITATFEDEILERVLHDGSFLTRSQSNVVHRSGVDGSELSRTDVGPFGQVDYDYALDAQLLFGTPIVGEIRIYEPGGPQVGTASSEIARSTRVSADGQVLFQRDHPGAIVIHSARPQPTGSHQELWQRGWFDHMTVHGVGIGSPIDVRVNGRSVPFEETVYGHPQYRSSLHLDVRTIPPSNGADIEVVNAAGTGTLRLESAPPRGQAILTYRVPTPDGGMNEGATVECGERENRYWAQHGAERAETFVLLVPTHQTCHVDHYGPATRGRFVNRDRPGAPSADIFDSTVTFRSGGAAHIDFEREEAPTRVMWIFAFAVGDPPAGARYRVRVTCGDWSVSRRVVAGQGVRLVASPEATNRCEARVTDKEGADHVRSLELAPATNHTDGREIRFRRGRSLAFVFDHGGADFAQPLVAGAPGETIGSKSAAGVVHVFPTTGQGQPVGRGSLLLRQGAGLLKGKARTGERLGHAVATSDFNGDGWADIAIAAPGNRLRGKRDVGVVHVLYGGPDGYDPRRAQTLHQGLTGVPGGRSDGDRFGHALAPLDFNGDGFIDLAVGVPGEDILGVRDSGAVRVFMGGPFGLRTDNVESLWQGGPGLSDRLEDDDRFGSVLAGFDAILAIGVPHEDIGRKTDAGVVHLVDGLTYESVRLRQGSPRQGKAERGDHFGASVAVDHRLLLVGVPGEDKAKGKDVGHAHAFVFRNDSSPAPFDLVHRHVDPARAEAGAEFGASVLIFPGDEEAGEFFAIGSPGSRNDAGLVDFYEQVGSIHVASWDQDTATFPGSRTPGARLGHSVIVGPAGTIVFGLPGARVSGRAGAGQVVSTWDFRTFHTIHQDRSGVPRAATSNDEFGFTIGG